MARNRIAIVGANLAGGRAAEALRARGFDGQIQLIGAERYPPYERPPLSKQVLLGLTDEDGPMLRTAREWQDLDVELIMGTRVDSIVPGERLVRFDSGGSTKIDQILLCTGSRSRRLSQPGADAAGIVYLRTLDQSVELRDRLQPGKRVVVIGGGLIGTEVAAAASQVGCHVTVVELDVRPLGRVIGPNLARVMLSVHRAHGVEFKLGCAPEAFQPDGRGYSVKLTSGERLAADVLVAGIGVEPETQLAVDAGAEVANGVVVDEFCRTRVGEGVLAAGDVANHPSRLFSSRLRLENWDHAQRHAQAAAASLLGSNEPYESVPWFWSDQYDVNLQVGGIPTWADERVVRGDPESLSFCEFGLRSGTLVSVTGINRAKDVRRSLRLIASQVRPDPELLKDESQDLRTLRTPIAAG